MKIALGSVIASVMLIALGVFLSVLGVVVMVKVLQIAEDLRYMRSKTDIRVQRPKPYYRLILVCVGVSVGVCLLLLMILAGSVNGMTATVNNISSFGK